MKDDAYWVVGAQYSRLLAGGIVTLIHKKNGYCTWEKDNGVIYTTRNFECQGYSAVTMPYDPEQEPSGEDDI